MLGDMTVDQAPVTSELYDPDTNAWSGVEWPSELSTNAGLAGMRTDDGRGLAYGESGSAEYDPDTNRWVASSAAAPPQSGQLVCMPGGRMLLFGDSNQEPFARLGRAASAEWIDSGRPSFHHNGSEAAVVLRDGSVLVTGWGYVNTDANRETEIFTAK